VREFEKSTKKDPPLYTKRLHYNRRTRKESLTETPIRNVHERALSDNIELLWVPFDGSSMEVSDGRYDARALLPAYHVHSIKNVLGCINGTDISRSSAAKMKAAHPAQWFNDDVSRLLRYESS
jgi:hypothetical protein